MAGTLASLLVHLGLEVDDWGRNSRRAKKDYEDFIDKIDDRSNKAAAGFLKLANNLSNIPVAIQASAGVTSTLGAMSGAIGLLPGVAAAGAAGMVALKVGVAGFGDAMKNVGDPEKFAESLKTLSPAARETALAVRDLTDDWERMQNSVQERLFTDLAGHAKTLGERYLPVMEKGLGGIASQFNDGAQKTAQFLGQARQVDSVAGIFGNAKDATGGFTKALQPITSILLDITAVSSDFLPNFAAGFGDAAAQAAELVRHARETGNLHQWISTGLSTLGQLWKLLKNIASIVGTIFDAFDVEGAGFLDLLVDITNKIKEFLKSAEGQQALHALADALNVVSAVVTDVMIAAFQELAPIIVEAAPGFAELARQVGSVLVSALRVVGPLLQGLAGFISDNIDWLGPMAIALYAGAQALGAVTTALRILSALAATNPWLLLIAATIVLVTLIITHWDQIKAALAAAWDWIKRTAGIVWEAIKVVIVNPIVSAWHAIEDAFNAVVEFFKKIPGWIGDAVSTVGEILVKPFRWAYDQIAGIVNDILEFVDRITGNLKTGITGGVNVAGKLANKGSGLGSGGHQFRAHGGPVLAGMPYIVGERGPELFQPWTSGTIIPNHDLPRVSSLGAMGGDGASAETPGGGYSFHIENFHATKDMSPRDISEELLWDVKARG